MDGSVSIQKGPPYRICKGFCRNEHKILEFAGVYSCSTCASTVCRFCCARNKKTVECFDCLRDGIFGVNDVSETEMRETLSLYNVHVPASAGYAEVMLLYDEVVDGNHVKALQNQTSKVYFPKFPSVFLDNIFTSYLKVTDFPRVVRDDSFTPQQVIDVVDLISQLVIRKSDTMVGQASDALLRKQYPVHTVMPDLLVHFALKSRVHSGLRLLKRAVRHAVDPLCPKILNDNIQIGSKNGKVFFSIKGKVCASMKTCMYETKVTFTDDT